MKYRISTPNERVWRITQLAKLSFNHSIGRTHRWLFSIFFMNRKETKTHNKSVPRSLQSWVSTIQSVVLAADVFQLFMKKINFSARIRISELWNPAAAGVRQCNTNNPSCSRLPGCQVSGLRTNIKHRITSLDININTSTRTVRCKVLLRIPLSCQVQRRNSTYVSRNVNPACLTRYRAVPVYVRTASEQESLINSRVG